jgi:hypothetical protein
VVFEYSTNDVLVITNDILLHTKPMVGKNWPLIFKNTPMADSGELEIVKKRENIPSVLIKPQFRQKLQQVFLGTGL